MSSAPIRTISIFIPSFRGGGAEGIMVRIANEFIRMGHDVVFIVIEDVGPWKIRLHKEVNVEVLKGTRLLVSFPFLVLYFLRSNPELLISNMSHMNVAAVFAAWITRSSTNLYLVEHNDLPRRIHYSTGWSFRFLVWAMSRAYPRANRIICVSEGVKMGVREVLDLPEDSMVVIPNGIDNEEIRALAARTADHPWFLDGSIPVLISIGRLVEQKGFDDLLNALQIVLRSTPVRLILLGEGPKRKALETLARDLNLGQHIDFHGFVANPYTFVKQSSLYVLSSRYEGFGIVILESLALGVPVISTDCPSGPGELLEGGRTEHTMSSA